MSALACGCDPDMKGGPYVSADCPLGHTGEDFKPEPSCWCAFADSRICPVHGKDADVDRLARREMC